MDDLVPKTQGAGTGQPSPVPAITTGRSFGKAFSGTSTPTSAAKQPEQTETEQRSCRAAVGYRSDLEREPLVRSRPPPPYIGAGRYAEAREGRVVKGHAIR